MKNYKETILISFCCLSILLSVSSLVVLNHNKKELTQQQLSHKYVYACELHQEDQELINILSSELKYLADSFDNSDVTLANFMAETSEGSLTFEDSLIITLLCKESFKNTKIDFRWMLAIMNRESNFKPLAYNPNDPARGICQITPPCLDCFNVEHPTHTYTFKEMNDYKKCLEVGIWFFKELCKDLSIDKAVSAYNQGRGGVKKKGVDGTPYFALIQTNYDNICSMTDPYTHLLNASIEVALK